jgi:hypothetical protein
METLKVGGEIKFAVEPAMPKWTLVSVIQFC